MSWWLGEGRGKDDRKQNTFVPLGHIYLITLLIVLCIIILVKKTKSFLILFPLNFGQNNPQRGIDWSNKPQFLVRLSV